MRDKRTSKDVCGEASRQIPSKILQRNFIVNIAWVTCGILANFFSRLGYTGYCTMGESSVSSNVQIEGVPYSLL